MGPLSGIHPDDDDCLDKCIFTYYDEVIGMTLAMSMIMLGFVVYAAEAGLFGKLMYAVGLKKTP